MSVTVLDSHAKARQLMYVTTMVGMLLLENGAEVYRTEDTMKRICMSQENIVDVDVLATPGWLFVSYRIDDDPLTKMRRVKSTTINLSKIAQLNDLSRRITARETSIEDAQTEVLQIAREKEKEPWISAVGGMVGAMGFTFYNGAGIVDGLCAGVAAGVMLYALHRLDQYKLSFFINTLIGALISTFTAFVLFLLGIVTDLDQAIIGALMILYPGVGITNSMRDALSGDFLSGLTHGMKALATALGIAVGVGLVLVLQREVLQWM